MRFSILAVAVVVLSVSCVIVSAQPPDRSRAPLVIKPSTRLIDQFGIRTGEERSARFDNLFSEISKEPGSIAYVVLYCGKKCQYGEIEAHIRGIEIKIALRQFGRSKLVVVNGEFREKFDTELWLVEAGSAPRK